MESIRTEARSSPAPSQQVWRDASPPHEGQAGTSAGINIAPGSSDDGWIIPPRVHLPDGTSVQLYKDGEALHAAFDAVRNARKRICLEVYIFRSDDTGRAFAKLLAQKAQEGLQIYVIYDDLACIDTDHAIFDEMAAAGVRLAAFHPIRPWQCRYSWRPFNRDHRKLLIIDDEAAGLGGLNVGGEYAGSWIVRPSTPCNPWRDNAIGIRGPGAQLLFQAFVRTWRYCQRGGRIRGTELLHNVTDGAFGILASVPARKSPLMQIEQMLREAKESVYLTMSYFAPPDELIEQLCRAARRKRRVRLMLPGQCDVPLLMIAARSFYETLLQAGCEVYERQGAILHAKTLCIDGQTTILGSTNLDYRSIEYNLELSVIIRNPQFGHQIHDLFENDVRYSRRITPGEWRRRPWNDRFIQWVVKRARYLL